MNLYCDSKIDDTRRRQELYNGSIFVYSPSAAAVKLCALAQEMIETAFRPHDPRTIQDILPVEDCVRILADLKPKFIHHPRSKALIQELLAERSCDLTKTYFDVPRLRSAFKSDYLTSGIAYAFHPHRDSWYSAPLCQINWWMPVYPLEPSNCMAIHPNYWSRAVKNGSSSYNYGQWNRDSRHSAASHIQKDTRVQPKPEEEMDLDPDIRIVCEVGGVYLFSAAQMHSTVPNTSSEVRYSIDFRTIHLDDAWKGVGARNVDSACTGTSMGDFLRADDLSHMPEEAVSIYNKEARASADTGINA